jgi:hypothetical protein
MHKYCHRCEGELATGDGITPFCQHCGAPQLFLPEQEPAASNEGEESTGVLPPPRPRQVEWHTAILCAAAVAAVAAILTVLAAQVPKLTFISWLWTISGAAIALGLYQRRKPQAWMDAGVGVRIGIVAGLALIVSIAVSMAVTGLVARFGLHAMGTFDSDLKAQIEKAAAMNPQPAEAMRYVKLPEFRAGIMLGGFAMMAGLVMLFSALGGAMSGMLRTRRS